MIIAKSIYFIALLQSNNNCGFKGCFIVSKKNTKRNSTPTNKRIGEKIKALRIEAGLSQDEFGSKYHLSQNDVTNIEHGYKTVSYELLLDIAKDYDGVTTDYLIRENGVRGNNPDLQYICDYTGLSEKAIEKLHNKTFNTEELLEIKRLDVDETKSFADYINDFVFSDNQVYFGFDDFNINIEDYNGDVNKAFEVLHAKQKEQEKKEKENQLLKIFQDYLNAANSLICSNYFDEIISSYLGFCETNKTIKALLRLNSNQDIIDSLSEDDLYMLYSGVATLNVINEQNLALFKAQNNILDFLKSQMEFSSEDVLKIYSNTRDLIEKKLELREEGEEDE